MLISGCNVMAEPMGFLDYLQWGTFSDSERILIFSFLSFFIIACLNFGIYLKIFKPLNLTFLSHSNDIDVLETLFVGTVGRPGGINFAAA